MNRNRARAPATKRSTSSSRRPSSTSSLKASSTLASLSSLSTTSQIASASPMTARRTISTSSSASHTIVASSSNSAPSTAQRRTHLNVSSVRHMSDAAAPTATKSRETKVDITQVEDVFRANRLAGLGDRYHSLNEAFNIIRTGMPLTPQLEQDLSHIYDVTSLKTADSRQVRKAKTQALVEHYQRRPGDTGSPEVQVVLLTERENYLKFHMTRHRADKALKLNFHKIQVRRRKLLKYLKKERFRTYQVICRDLGIDEESMDIIGRLKNTKPYYDPDRPVYRKPMSAQELREMARLEDEKKIAAEVERKRDVIQRRRDEQEERRRYAAEFTRRNRAAAAAAAAASSLAPEASTQEEEDIADTIKQHNTTSTEEKKSDV